jgi:hypothetical protein
MSLIIPECLNLLDIKKSFLKSFIWANFCRILWPIIGYSIESYVKFSFVKSLKKFLFWKRFRFKSKRF